VARALLVAVCVILLTGCGATKRACESPQERQALAHLDADLAVIKRAATLPAPDPLKGNAAINHATDRFLLHLETAPIDNLQRNRMIDHAAALLVGSCELCFQALEAERPIVSIAHGDLGCPKADGRGLGGQRRKRVS
jgi:hypothetical protein